MPKQMLQKGEIYSTRLVVFSEPFDVRTDPGGDISLDRGETVRKWVGINKNTIVDWFNLCREVCAVYMDQIETEKIGGVGKVVEIDESKFGKRKYNRGRRREGQWVLGGVERGSEEMFMQIVPSRDAATLLPVIITNVKPGTEIHTDEWRSYARLNRRGYVHHTVNYSIEFVNPANGAHTQSIECTWAHAKKKYKMMHGFKSTLSHILSGIYMEKKNCKRYTICYAYELHNSCVPPLMCCM